MQRRLMAALICVLTLLSVSVTAFGMEFSDVPVTASYYKAVDRLSNDGVIQGRGDGVFAPGDNTTRAEFCAFIARANNYNSSYHSVEKLPFSDVKGGNWAEGYISYCYSNGYVNGMSEDTFAPSSNITCEQAVKMVVCASGVGDESLSKVGPKWYSGYINVARKYNLLDGTEFKEGKPANRAFVAQIVYNSMLVKGEDKKSGSHAVDVAGNKNSGSIKTAQTDTSSQTAAYEPEEIWEPTQEDNAWKYYQYYGEDYESYMQEDENKNNYSVPNNRESDETDNEYVPRGSSDGMLIVIDPGHNYSGVDTGAVGNGLREQDITFYIAEKLKPILERNGFDVIMTRNSLKENVSDESVSASLTRRSEIANRNGADLFVSIHCNAGGGTGVETYYCTDSNDGKVFASFIQKNVVKTIGLRDRGVKNARYAVLRNTDMTALLLETGFIDTASDAAYLGSSEYQQKYAEAIAKGICEYVGVEYNG